MSEQATVFTIPENPTPQQLQQLLAVCSNQIATLVDIVATKKADVAFIQTKLKQEIAKATIWHRNNGPASIVKAMVETDAAVVVANEKLDTAEAAYLLAKARLDGFEAHFVALRKIAELRKTEINGGVG